MTQENTHKPTLTVSNTVTDNGLLQFRYLNDSAINSDLTVTLPFKTLAQSENYSELWQDSGQTVVHDSQGDARLIYSDYFLTVIFNTEASNLGEVVDGVYDQAFNCSQRLNFPHLIRVWNFFPAINDNVGGMENYQRFCVARHAQLERHHQLNQPNPAATAIGTHNQQSAYVFIFAKQAGEVIENKRQVSAWEYPLHYSPKQPRFSRAMRVGGLLMCSGTASVVGHQTKHKDDLKRQFAECLTNIRVLLDSAENESYLKDGLFRFYLRHKNQLPELQQCIIEAGLQYYVILAGDICRDDLLVECEAVFQQ